MIQLQPGQCDGAYICLLKYKKSVRIENDSFVLLDSEMKWTATQDNLMPWLADWIKDRPGWLDDEIHQ